MPQFPHVWRETSHSPPPHLLIPDPTARDIPSLHTEAAFGKNPLGWHLQFELLV